jgi:hypothetical protein
MTVSSINNCTPRKCKKPVRPHHDHTQLFCIQTAWWQVLIVVPNNLYRRIAAKSKRRLFAISCNRIFPKLMTKESAQIFASEICLACWAASVGQKRRPFDSRPVDWWWSYRLEEDVTGHIHGVDFLSWSSWLIPEFGLVRVMRCYEHVAPCFQGFSALFPTGWYHWESWLSISP